MPLCCFVFGSSKASKRPPQRPEPQRRVSTAEGKAAEKKETTTVELTAVTSLQSADTAIQKPAPIQAGPTPAPTATSSAWRGVKDIAVNGLITALKVTKEATPIFPPLQSAAGGILAIIDVFQKMSSNKDDIEMLTRYLEKLGEFYKTVSASFPGDYKRACPEALRKRLEDFDREVREIEQDVRKLGARALPAQLLNADDTAEEIDGFVRRLSMLVNNLVVGGTISIELAVDELQIVIIQGFDHMDDRFDGISDQIDGLGTQINQLLNESGAGLRYTIQARFDFHKSGRSACDSNTRREALATVYAWLRPDDPRLSEYPAPLHNVRPENPVFWINGLAGTGKSTLAQTIAHWCEDVDFLGATFFCARDGDRNNVSLIVPTIAHQLGSFCPSFRAEVSEAVKANPDIHGSLVSRQLQKLIVEPLRAVKAKESFPPCAIVIDALDECKDDEAVSVVLKGLALYVAKLAPLKFVITSRPIQRVTDGFSLENLIDHTQQFSLSTIPVEATKRDIANFLRTRLADIKRRYYVGGYWPSDQEVDELVELASELFIFAATAVKFVGDGRTNDPERQLVFLLRPSEPSSVAAARDSPYRYLDALYLQVLKSAFPKLDRRVRAEMKNILGTIALVQEQLHPGALEALLHLKGGLVRRTLRDVHSIIVVPPTDEEVIRVIHRSFADFIVDRDRCTESDFLVHSSLQHTVIANHCLQNLFLLRRDICQVRNESLLNIEIPDFNARVARHIPPHLQYACKYWAYHLCHAELEQEVINHLGTFCRSYLLFWLEALSLLGSLDIAVEALQSSRNALQKLPLPPADVISILYDSERVVRFCYPAISASCFQAYKCALPFSPTSSLLRALFASQASGTVQVLSGLQKSWSPNIMAPEGHGGRVQCVGYSPNGERIVSCSEDVTIRLWDARTGTPLHVLEGHTARVCSVAFSPSGKQLLSGSDDLTVKLWDATTGSILGTWKRHSRDVRSVVWSSDGRYAASGSYDTTVVVWPVADPDDTTVFTEHIDEVDSIFFDSDGDLLSGSHDGRCKVWDVDRKTCKRTLTHPSPVMCVAGSRDSKIIASGCRDFTVTMWSKADGSRLHVLKQHAWWIWSLDFSPDNRTLASGSWDHISKVRG
ncbi:hypothetical protein C2E23DRAFT_903842 [Lenzites betulinus]|nr:hypothetical protein C2E23DRAFT_903842 [Lenzites betulinus]